VDWPGWKRNKAEACQIVKSTQQGREAQTEKSSCISFRNGKEEEASERKEGLRRHWKFSLCRHDVMLE
jgi:hypothetical protein